MPTIKAVDGTEELYNTAVSDIQSNIVVTNGVITGNLAYVDSGTLATTYGAGNFIALEFDDLDEDADTIMVGLTPSDNQLVDILDVTGGKEVFEVNNVATQKFIVQATDDNGRVFTKYYDISRLVCATE